MFQEHQGMAPTYPRSEGIRAEDVQQVVTQFRRRNQLRAELQESWGVFHCDKTKRAGCLVYGSNGQARIVLTCRRRVGRVDRDAFLPPGR